jgi:predicted nucleotidyltransferase
MKRNNSTRMAESEHEPDTDEEFQERVDRIIERERPILDRLADE